jgi:hypothetical protein
MDESDAGAVLLVVCDRPASGVAQGKPRAAGSGAAADSDVAERAVHFE